MAKKDRCFYRGNFRKDADEAERQHKRWFVGAYLEAKPRKTELVEIKHWKYERGARPHDIKTSCTIECTLILCGKITGMVAGRDITLSGGDYVVIAPGTPNALPQKVLEDVEGVTIKAPSIPVAKHIKVKLRRGGWRFRVELCKR